VAQWPTGTVKPARNQLLRQGSTMTELSHQVPFLSTISTLRKRFSNHCASCQGAISKLFRKKGAS